jgi:hypothetical protein
LLGANATQLRTLLKVLHNVANGKILMPLQDYKEASKVNGASFTRLRKELGSREKTIHLLKETRQSQCAVANKFYKIYGILLYKLFNQ